MFQSSLTHLMGENYYIMVFGIYVKCSVVVFMEMIDIIDKDELRYDWGTVEDEKAQKGK